MTPYRQQKKLTLLIFQNAVENFEVRIFTKLSFKKGRKYWISFS